MIGFVHPARCNSTLQEDPFLCNCQGTMPSGQRLMYHIEKMIDPKVIKRAMISCENSGRSILDQFPEVRNLVEGGVAPRSKIDYELTRYACYLIVQNGDPRKEVIALGQTYFAIQTYRQEVANHFNQLDEDRRRLVVRGDIKQWNQLLAETAHDAGVISNESLLLIFSLWRPLIWEKICPK